MKKKTNKIFNIFDVFSEGIDAFIFGVPYVFISSLGFVFKILFLTFLSILTLDKFIKLKVLWNKEYFLSNFVKPWNFVIGVVSILVILNII